MPVVEKGTSTWKFSYDTGEYFDEAEAYLDSIGFVYKSNYDATYMDILNPVTEYKWIRYWPGTGRWIPKYKLKVKRFRAYNSKGIKDFVVRFMPDEPNYPVKKKK
jgi:hypothetical protein